MTQPGKIKVLIADDHERGPDNATHDGRHRHSVD